jgi:PAS domain S-box-containing protein
LFEKNAHVHPGGLAAVPLMVEGRRLGALQLCFAEGRHPQDLDADFLMTVAGLTAQALERAKLFDDVERSEQLLRTLAEVADQQVWVEGPGDKLEYINSRACQYIGVPEEELRAMGARALCARIWDPDDLRAHAAQMQDAPRDQKMEIFVRLRRADGAYRSHLIRVVPLPDASGAARRWVGTATDVEQLLQAQAALRDKQAEEHRFRELLLGIVGHDLRNPLAAIGSWVQVLQVHPDVAQQDEALARIDRTLARMRRMIAQLLDFTHARQTGTIPVQPRPADLGAICRAVVDELSSASGGRLWLEATGDLAGKWDPDRLAQLVSNLAGNSLQHGDGGRVELRVTGAGDEVLVEVHNRGPVIAGSELAHLFDPYRRGRAATTQHGSLGLGLYIVQRIVHAHGGSIAVTSTAEAGTTFRVRLPRINTG